MPRSVEAKQVLRRLHRSGWLARLGRQELRLFLFVLSGMLNPSRPRRWRPSTLRRTLGLSEAALERAVAGLERQGWLQVVRSSRNWLFKLAIAGRKR